MTVKRNVSIFDHTVPNHAPQNPTLSLLLRRMVTDAQRGLRVCLPGKVEVVDSSYRVDVRPCLQAQFNLEPNPITLPIIPNVPVQMPSGAAYRVRYPVAVGDVGLLIFADRSLDKWLAGDGGVVDPEDARLHDLTDAIFVPGLMVDAAALTYDDASDDLVMQNGLASLRIQGAGKYVIGNSVAELVDQVQQMAKQLETLSGIVAALTYVPPPPVPVPPVPVPVLGAAAAAGPQAAATQIAALVNTLKGS